MQCFAQEEVLSVLKLCISLSVQFYMQTLFHNSWITAYESFLAARKSLQIPRLSLDIILYMYLIKRTCKSALKNSLSLPIQPGTLYRSTPHSPHLVLILQLAMSSILFRKGIHQFRQPDLAPVDLSNLKCHVVPVLPQIS